MIIKHTFRIGIALLLGITMSFPIVEKMANANPKRTDLDDKQKQSLAEKAKQQPVLAAFNSNTSRLNKSSGSSTVTASENNWPTPILLTGLWRK